MRTAACARGPEIPSGATGGLSPPSTHAFELRPPTEMTNRTGAWMVKALSFSTIQSSSPSFKRARRGACPFRQHR